MLFFCVFCSYVAVEFGFGYAEILVFFYVLFGFFKDELQLKVDNFKFYFNRKFRVSRVLSFLVNFVVALYQCDLGEDNNDYLEYVVRFYVNEKIVDILACAK